MPELQAVLGYANRIERGADQLDAVLFEHAMLTQLHRQVERRLPADRR